MQAGQDMLAAATTSVASKPSSLRQFARFGAVAIGIVTGVTVAANAASARESTFRSAIFKRDEKIAELTAANEALSETTPSGKFFFFFFFGFQCCCWCYSFGNTSIFCL